MSFLHPMLAVAGALCVAIPVIVHFFMRRRQKPISWGAMRFLVEAYRKTRRRFQFEQLLLLICRCLVILLAAAAIAGPLLGGAETGSRAARTLVIVLDDSLAAQARDASGVPALERLKELAGAMLDELEPSVGDRAAIIGAGSPSRGILVPPTSDVATAKRALDEAVATDARCDWQGAADLVRRAMTQDEGQGPGDVVVAVLSEFRAGSLAGLQPIQPITEAGRLRVLAPRPREGALPNIAVMSAEPLRSLLIAGRGDEGAAVNVSVTLRRFGQSSLGADTTNVLLRQAVPGDRAPTTLAQRVAVWQPGQSETMLTIPSFLPPESGSYAIEAHAAPVDAIEGDSSARSVVEVRERLRIGLVTRGTLASSPGFDAGDPADWLRAAVQPAADVSGDVDLDLVDVEAPTLGIAPLSSLDALFILSPGSLDAEGWAHLARYVDAGGVVITFPEADAASQTWGDEMLRALAPDWTIRADVETSETGWRVTPGPDPAHLLATIAGEAEALTSPVRVQQRLRIGAPTPAGVLVMNDGSPLVAARFSRAEGEKGGLLIVCAVPPSLLWTDLPARPLFVPLIQELVRQGVSETLTVDMAVAGHAIELRPGASLSSFDGTTLIRRAEDGRTAEPVRTAAFYQESSEGSSPRYIAVDPDRSGSDTAAAPEPEVVAMLSSLGDPSFSWLGEGEPQGERTYSTFAGAFRVDRQPGVAALPLLMAALLLALIETVLARVFSHASTRELSAAPASVGVAS